MPEADRLAERKAAGLCTACGRDKAEAGRGKCAACAQAAREAEAARRATAAEKGLCEACHTRKRWQGQTRCKTCRDKYLAAQLERDHETQRRRADK